MRCDKANVRGATPELHRAQDQAAGLFRLAAKGAAPLAIVKFFHADVDRAHRFAFHAFHPDKLMSADPADRELVAAALTLFTTALDAHKNPHDEDRARTFENAREAASAYTAWAAGRSGQQVVPAPVQSRPVESVARVARMQNPNAQRAAAAYEATLNLGRPTSRFSAWA